MRACRPSERLTIFAVKLHLKEKRPITDTALSQGDIRHELAEVHREYTQHSTSLLIAVDEDFSRVNRKCVTWKNGGPGNFTPGMHLVLHFNTEEDSEK
jgi:hypothetical protein